MAECTTAECTTAECSTAECNMAAERTEYMPARKKARLIKNCRDILQPKSKKACGVLPVWNIAQGQSYACTIVAIAHLLKQHFPERPLLDFNGVQRCRPGCGRSSFDLAISDIRTFCKQTEPVSVKGSCINKYGLEMYPSSGLYWQQTALESMTKPLDIQNERLKNALLQKHELNKRSRVIKFNAETWESFSIQSLFANNYIKVTDNLYYKPSIVSYVPNEHYSWLSEVDIQFRERAEAERISRTLLNAQIPIGFGVNGSNPHAYCVYFPDFVQGIPTCPIEDKTVDVGNTNVCVLTSSTTTDGGIALRDIETVVKHCDNWEVVYINDISTQHILELATP